MLDKWNGQLPQVQGSNANPLFNLNPITNTNKK